MFSLLPGREFYVWVTIRGDRGRKYQLQEGAWQYKGKEPVNLGILMPRPHGRAFCARFDVRNGKILRFLHF